MHTRILMHLCCANCGIYPLEMLFMKDVCVKGLWYNPNIHPFTEYAQRRDSVETLMKTWHFEVEFLDEYPLDDFLRAVVGTGPGRCEVCYSLRLEKTAEIARKMHMDGFTTSLLASPYQKFDMINDVGNEVAKRHGIPFLSNDFRKGWALSRDLSREFGLYRQKYCGCIYSEMERYRNPKKKKTTD